MSLRKDLYSWASGSGFMQKLYGKNVEGMLYAMGIGSGEAVNSSGEKSVFSLVRRLIRPPYCIFDVGANEGQFLDACRQALKGTDFNIHSFEPLTNTFQILEQRFGNWENASLNRMALGSVEESRLVHFSKKAAGLASLSKRDLDHLQIEIDTSEMVEVQTVDGYCSKNRIEKIQLLKIDVEGHELDVMRGASNLFRNHAIDLVMFEFGGTHIDTRLFFKDYWHFLTGYGFRLFRITPRGYLVEITRYREILEIFLTTNFLAVRSSLYP